jgi:hypothetical protein
MKEGIWKQKVSMLIMTIMTKTFIELGESKGSSTIQPDITRINRICVVIVTILQRLGFSTSDLDQLNCFIKMGADPS